VVAQETAKEPTSRLQQETAETMEKKRKHCEETVKESHDATLKLYETRASEVRQATKLSRVVVHHHFPLLEHY
jgi:cellobiose-specific phosphotransferase system component IIA